MSQENIIRAWKDETFRLNLSEKERALLPEHPAGLVELSDTELENAVGMLPIRSITCTCTEVNDSCG